MTQISVIAKESHTLLNRVDSNTVSLSENSVVVVKIPKEDVASITRSGDSAMINLKNGQVIVVENYFNMANPDNSLVFEGEDGSLYWAKFTDEAGAIADVIQYQPLSEIEPLLYKDSLTGVILPWALGAGGAGLIGAAASGGGGSSDDSGNAQPAAAPKKLAAFEVADNAAPKIGKLASGDVSNDKTPVVSGSGAEPGAAIKVYDAGQVIASATAKADGTWSVEIPKELLDGAHSITVTQTVNGAEGPKSDVLDFTVDTKVPAVSIDDLGETNNSKPLISGQTNEPKAEIEVVIKDQSGNVIDSGKGAVDANGSWTYTPKNPLPEGEYDVEVKAKDPAGNESAASGGGLTVDTTKPVISIDPLELTNDDTPAIQGAAEKGAAVTVEIKDAGGNTVESGNAAVDGNGNWTYTPKAPLADGAYTVAATAADPAGNTDTASGSGLTVDTVKPAVSIEPLKPTNDNTPAIQGAAEKGAAVTVEIKDAGGNTVESGNAAVDGNGNWTYTPKAPLADGAYTVAATAADPAGNTDTASGGGLTVDTTKPAVSIEPLKPTNDNTPAIQGAAEKGAAVKVEIKDAGGNTVESGNAAVDGNGNWTYTLKASLADGAYTVAATATDAAGNSAFAADANLKVDTVPPTVDINDLFAAAASRMLMSAASATASTVPQTNQIKPTFSGSSTKSIEVMIYLQDGTGKTVDSGLAKLDTATGKWAYTPSHDLAEGYYMLQAISKDVAGNQSEPAAKAFIVDIQSPIIEIQDVGLSNDATPDVKGKVNEPTSAVTVKVVNAAGTVIETGKAAVASDGTWKYTVSANLADGAYQITANAKDKAGNVTADVSASAQIDTAAPTSVLTVSPNGDVIISFSETVKGFDQSGITVQGGTLTHLVQQADGSWTGQVTADGNTGTSGSVTVKIADDSYTDLAGNAGKGAVSASVDVPSIDTTAPSASISVAADGAVTVVFSEPVKGFEPSDLKVAGGNLLDLTEQPDGSWTGHVAANGVTGASAQVGISISAGAYADLAGNLGQAASGSAVVPSLDTTAPAPTLALDANGHLTITFNEPVKGFDASDVKVDGGTVSGLSQQLDGSWTGKVAAHGNTGLPGSVVVSIADGSYADLAGNAGKGGFIYATVPSVDATAPAASISIATNGEVIISFSEAVKGFDASDVKVAGGTLADLVQQADGSWKGHAVANGSTGALGKVELSIDASSYQDLAGNPGQAASQSQNIPSADSTAPAASISIAPNGEITISFSEPVTGFDASDVQVAGGTLSGLTQQADGTWKGQVIADGSTGAAAQVNVSIPAGSYADNAGNLGQSASQSQTVPSADTAAPSASIAVDASGNVTVTFSEPVKDFEPSDLKIAGGTLLDLVQQPDGSWKGHAVSNDPTGTPGKVELSIAAGAYTDHSGNPGQAAAQSQTVPSIDVTAPSSSIQLSADGDIVISFSEPVKGFDASDVKVAGGTLISLTEQADGTWTGKVAANGATGAAGSIAVEVAANSYTDLAGNAGKGATAVQVVPSIDSTAPVSAMTLDADGSLRISFSEAVKGFDASDVQVSGGTVSGLSQQADGSWTGQVIADGSTGASAPVTVTVADGSYSDLAGNAGKGSSANNVSVPSIDSTAPAVTIGLDENGLVKFTFSEKVFNFDAADVNVTGGTLTDFVKVSDTLWTAKVQPAVSGVTNFVKLAIDAGSYQDKAGNQGLKGDASGDIIPPTVGIDDFDFFAASFAAPVAMFAARAMLAAAPLPPATNNPSQTFSGTSTKSVEVRIHIYDSSNQLIDSGLAKLDTATGRWTFTPSKPLADGLFTLEAISTDASGLVSAPSYKDFIIDTVKPEIEIDQAGTAADVAPSFSGKTEAGSTVTVTVKDKAGNVVETGAGIVDAQGNWTYSAKALADGDYTVEAAAKDRAGNVSDKASTPLTVDTQAQLDGLTVTANADGTATLSGKTEPGATVTVKDPNGKDIPVTVNPDGTFTASVPAPAAEGIYTATATDQAGNRGTAAEELKDAVAPKIDGFNVESHPDGTATLSGKTEPGATVTVKDPNGKDIPITVNPDGTFTASVPAPAAEGTYTAVATDQAGNQGHASDDLTDTTVPGLLTAEVNQNDGATVFGQAQPGALITVYSTDGKTVLGKGTVDASGRYTVSLNTAQVDGESVKVTAKDPGGESLPKMASAPDLYAPDAPAAQVTADGKAVTGSTEPNAEITVYGGSKGTTVLAVGKADANGSYTVALNPALVDGEAVKVTAKDPGGESLAASAIAPDLYAPAAPEAALDAQGQNVTGHSEAFAEITVYSADGKTILAQDKADSAGHFSIQLPSALTDAQQILVTARDKGGESDPKALTAQNIAMDAADNLVTANVDFIYPVEETRTSKLFNVFDAVNIGTKTHAGYFNVGDQEIGEATISVKTGSLVNLFDKAEMRLFQMDADGSWKLIASNKDSGLLDIFGLFGEGAAVRANNLQPGNYKFEFVGGSAIGLFTSVSANLSLKVFDTSVNPAVSGTAEATGNVISDTDSVYGKDSVPAGSIISSVNGKAVNGATVIDGAYGSLTIQKDGAYSYAPKADVAAIGKADVFSYTVKDLASGKESAAELIIHIGTQSDLALNWNDSHPKEDASTVAATDNNDFIGVDASNTVTAGKAGSISYSWAIGAGGTKSGSTKLTVADGTIEDVKISFGSVQLASFLGGTVVNIYDKAHKLIATTGASTLIDIITLLPNGNSLNLNGLKAGEYTVEAITNKGFSIFGSVSATISRSVIDLDDFTVKSAAVQSKGNIFSDNDGHGADTLASKYTDLYISKDGGLTYTAVKSTGTEIEGQYGKLNLKADGSYTYTATDAKALSGHSEEFTYKLAAPNGDVSTATLSIQASVNFTASTGNDVITSTAGNDVFNAKTGADTIIFKVLNSSDAAGGNGHDTWADFSKAQGDKIDVSQLLQGQGADKSNIGQFISVAGDGKGNTVISIDRDGLSAKAHDKVELLTLKNTDIGLQELLDNNHLVF